MVTGRTAWIALILTSTFFATSALAEAPSAQNWLLSLSPKKLATGTSIHRVLIATGIKNGRLLTPDIDSESFSNDSFFDLIEGREAEYCDLLNQRTDATDATPSQKSLEVMFAAAFRYSQADTILYAPLESEHWSFYRPDPQLGAKKEFMVKGPEQRDADAIKKWIIAKIGYGGVLLAQDKNYLLVGMYQKLGEGGSAMLVLDSDGMLRIKKSQMAGSALLRRRDCYRNVCVFEILIPTKSQYPLGSKVFF